MHLLLRKYQKHPQYDVLTLPTTDYDGHPPIIENCSTRDLGDTVASSIQTIGAQPPGARDHLDHVRFSVHVMSTTGEDMSVSSD